MVRRILQLLGREVRGLHEAAYLLAFFAFLSQILELIRDRLLAHTFGAGELLDVYYAAFRIPDFIFVTIASVVSLSVLIPFLIERSNKSKEEGQAFIHTIFNFFVLFVGGISIVVYIFTPELLTYLFPGFSDTQFDELIILTRILLLQPILLGASSLFASVVHVYTKFILYAISPLLYNLGIIVGIVFFYDSYGTVGLGYGVVLGAALHLAIQLPFIIRAGYFPRISSGVRFADIKKVILLSLPRTIALSSNQIALLVLFGFASLMSVGSISIFSLAFNLQSVPLVIIGASYSVAAFPTLARLFNDGNRQAFFEHITVAARHIIFWSFPAIALFIVLRAHIVRVIFGAGEFSWTDTRLTAAALAIFSISLIAQSLILLFVRGYYAAGRTVTPVVINVFSSSLIIVCAFWFSHLYSTTPVFRYFIEVLFRVEGISGTAVLMLPLAYTTATILNALLLWYVFERDFATFSRAMAKTFFQSLSAAVILGFTTYLTLILVNSAFQDDTFFGIFGQGLVSGLVGIAFGILTLTMLKSTELSEAWTSFHKKFWKTTIISSE